MPALDPQSEAIIAAYIENGGNQTEAWKVGHPNSKAKPASIRVEASKFFSDPNIRLTLAERQSKVASEVSAKLSLTLESHAAELERLREMAKERGLIAAAVAAEVKRGEVAGLYIKKVDVKSDNTHHVAESVSETSEWIRNVLREREAKQAKKPSSH